MKYLVYKRFKLVFVFLLIPEKESQNKKRRSSWNLTMVQGSRQFVKRSKEKNAYQHSVAPVLSYVISTNTMLSDTKYYCAVINIPT